MGDPSPAELLRAALEKIVFFEWRLKELSAELSAAHSRCAAAELERARAEDDTRAAEQRARAARMQLASLEAERARLASLLAQPTRGAVDHQALEAERIRSAQLESQLVEARRAVDAGRAERERWLNEMVEQAKSGDEAPAALAQFISELRGEIIALREHQKRCDALLLQHGIDVPVFKPSQPPPPAVRPPEAVEQARQMLAEGRLGAIAPEPSQTTHFAVPQPRAQGEAAIRAPLTRDVPMPQGIAARALADQCIRNLTAADPERRAQAARHLAAVPVAAAGPVLAATLGTERDVKARAQMARALAACAGEAAAELIARLQSDEAALVRLSALEALCTLPARAHAAVEHAARDASPAVRRRAAALAVADGFDDLIARFSADADATVRASCVTARTEAPPPETSAAARAGADAAAEAPDEAARPDPAAGVLQAVQAAIFGLTEDELAEHIGVPAAEAKALAESLLAKGRLGRRGKRLVLAEGAAR